MSIGSGFLLAAGTFTAIPVPPPARVDRSTARAAMLVAPLAVLPVAALVAGVATGLVLLGVPAMAAGLVGVAVLALGTRAIHLDGLADTCDALGVPGNRDRALAVMRQGDVGPMGAASLVLAIALQAACLGEIVTRPWGWVLALLGVAISRLAVTIGASAGLPAARAGGLGHAVAGSVPVVAMVIALLGWIVLLVGSAWATGYSVVSALVAGVGAVVAAGAWFALAYRRFGGITGDVLGGGVEMTCCVLLLGLTITV